jgi:uncharacterized alpha-E superfamily protein
VISRVAEHLFWLGRYVERAESSARVLLVTRNLALDGEIAPRQVWPPAVIVCGEEASFRERWGDAGFEDAEVVQEWLTWSEQSPSSIARSVTGARENARAVREAVSLEVWETVNEHHVWMRGSGMALWREDRHGFYRRVRQWGQHVLGVVWGTMLHDDALDFIGLGVMLERTNQTARILDVHHHALTRQDPHHVVETALWLALLRACSGFEPFMKRYQGKASAETVARFLVLDARFPRSILHCLDRAGERLARVRTPEADARGRSLQRLRALHGRVADDAVAAVEKGRLHDLLTHVVDETHAICDEVGRELLGHAPSAASGAPAR